MKKIGNNLRQSSVILFAASFLGVILPFSGCDDDDASLPEVTAGFTHTINANTGIVTFAGTSRNANTYRWNFGDETTSDEVNPVKKYVNGTYAVTLTAINLAGATDTFSDTLTILIKEGISLPVTFDEENTRYEANMPSGTSFSVLNNPDLSGSNNKASKVGAITTNGVVSEGISFDLGKPVSLITDKSVIMNFWAKQSVEVRLRLEGETGDPTEKTVTHRGSGWETLAFDFDSEGAYLKLMLFTNAPGTFFIDDIIQEVTVCRDTDLKLPIDFDCDSTDYTFKTFGGAGYRIITNPQVSSINNSVSLIAEITNSGKAGEGSSLMLDIPVSFSSKNVIAMKMYSTVKVPVSLRFEQDGTSVTATDSHSGEGWELLLFEFDAGGEFSTLSLLIDEAGITPGIFYIDDIEQGNKNVFTCIKETDESFGAADFHLTFQNNPADNIRSFDVSLEWADNPDVDNAINNSCKVGKVTRTANTTFDNNQILFDTKIDFSISDTLEIKVYAPEAFTVTVKLEDSNNTDIATDMTKTALKTNEWQKLVFPFPAEESGKYDRIVLFFDLGKTKAGTYYFDDFRLF